MATIQWDRQNLMPGKVSTPKVLANNTSGGVGFGGSEIVIGNTPGRWGMKFSDISLNTAPKIRAWSALASQLQGRRVPVLIPVLDRNRGPSTPVTATMSGAVAGGAVSESIKVADGGGVILQGMHFSIAERLYRLSVLGAGSHAGGFTTYPATLWPPVREPIADGAALEFNDPWFRVRLATDTEMQDVDLDGLKFGTADVNFLEDA